MIAFSVHGIPRPQGSTRAFVVKGRAVTTNKTPGLEDWRRAIASAAQPYARMLEGAVAVECAFRLARPRSLPKTKPRPATKRPDLDRLARAVLDGLTGVTFTDDSQVTRLVCDKAYARIGAPVGVAIRIGSPDDPSWAEIWPPEAWDVG